MSTLRRFLDVRPEERRNTFAAFATLLLVTTGHTLLETARDAFFLAKMPVSRQTMLFSATLEPGIVRLATSMLKDPVRISVDSQQTPHVNIEQRMHIADDMGSNRPNNDQRRIHDILHYDTITVPPIKRFPNSIEGCVIMVVVAYSTTKTKSRR